MSNITLPRAVVYAARGALLSFWMTLDSDTQSEIQSIIRKIDAALAEPEPEPEQNVLRRDAERYRWLRGEVQGPHTPLAQVVWKRNNIRESGDWTNLSDGQALDEAIDAALDAALAEPDAKREPATHGEISEKFYNAGYDRHYRQTDYRLGWRAAERFHGIRKEDGK